MDDYKSSMRYGNVLSGKVSESEERQHSIAQQKKTLPIYGMKNEILRVVRENQVGRIEYRNVEYIYCLSYIRL